ncbi:helix-turn-helix domain-containing protein [Endozoicomonas lisbonensis]|uniref:helix-turn-helix domain-containing protein n=1 Tax=Endozoicomonas lisbonensis TaxID=3120522 RepID=UPI003390CD7C
MAKFWEIADRGTLLIAPAEWKARIESLMQRMKLQKQLSGKLGADHPQVQAGNEALRSEGCQCWRVNDFFTALESAKRNISEALGDEYPMLIDGNDLTDFFESRVEQGISLGELDIEASLLKIIFQWGATPQPHKANKVQFAFEQVVQCNVHQLPAAEEPYRNERFCPEDVETEDSDSTESDSLTVRAYQLSLQGLSQREIAKALEISQSSVYRALKKAELS